MSKKRTVSDLREMLFDTLEQLKNPESGMDIDRAKAVSEVAQVIINTAKAEIDFVKATGIQSATSDFLKVETEVPTVNGHVTRSIGMDGLATTRHRMS
jgi:hypothetical protein